MDSGRRRADSAMGEIQALITRLSDSCTSADNLLGIDQITKSTNALRELRHLLVDSVPPRTSKDAFRRANGFETIFNVILLISARLTENGSFDARRVEYFEALKCSLMTISEALFDHPRNRQYCSDLQVWTNVEHHLGDVFLSASTHSERHELEDAYEKQTFFGLLFAVGLCEESIIPIFRATQSESASSSAAPTSSNNENLSLETFEGGPGLSSNVMPIDGPSFRSADFLLNPEVIPIIFNGWLRLESLIESLEHNASAERSLVSNSLPEQAETYMSLLKDLALRVVLALRNMTRASTFNAVALHSSRVLRAVLEATFSSSVGSHKRTILTDLSLELLKLGVKSLDDTAYFFRVAEDNPSICETLLTGVRSSRDAPRLVFDLSVQGYASVEFPQLKSSFPPKDSYHGYSLTAWIRVADFDNSCHTTIFGAFDASQTCFVLLYLESGTHQLVLQTSLSSKNPSVRFKSVTFQRRRWYHVAIVHHRRSSTSPGRASLFVDGQFCEQKKCPYPEPPAPLPEGQNADPQSQRSYNPSPVQCFFGTPQDLSPRLGKNVLSSKWELAHANLFQGILSEDLVFVYCQMGPLYRGNFQDCLGSFQTYNASTVLNLRNEERHTSDGIESIISTAVRSKASRLNPEQNLLISISPHMIISAHDYNHALPWNAKAKAKFENHFNTGSTTLIINSAIPVMTRAVAKPSGLGSVMGGVVVYRPSSIEDKCWCLTGCVTTSLRLVAQASTPATLILALRISIELVRENWRNSEAMERGSGFGALAWMLRAKLFPESSTTSSKLVKQVNLSDDDTNNSESLAETLLRSLLDFVGFNFKASKKSTINNPLAYRQLIVDCGVWEKADPATQKLYFEQFVVFATQSDNHAFNARRLNRMRIIKRFIDTLKAGAITPDVVPLMQDALKALLQGAVTAEVLRSLALYVTFALFSNESSRAKYGIKRAPDNVQVDVISTRELGVQTLQMLSSFLCSSSDNTPIHKFARTVTSKWLLHLLSSDDARVIISAFTILVRVLLTGGSKFLAKFEEKHGFIILRRRLQRWWHVGLVWSRCWELLFGPEYINLFLHDTAAASAIARTFQSGSSVEFFCPSVARIMLAMAGYCLTDCLLQERRSREHTGKSLLTSADKELEPGKGSETNGNLDVVTAAVDTLLNLHSSNAFRGLSSSKQFTPDLLAILYSATRDNIENRSDATRTRQGSNLYIPIKDDVTSNNGSSLSHLEDSHPSSPSLSSGPNLQRADSRSQTAQRIRRNSSFVMVNSTPANQDGTARFTHPLAPESAFTDDVAFKHSLFFQLVKLLALILADQAIHQQEFSGLGLFLKAPQATAEKRSSINSFVLKSTINEITENITANPKYLHDPKILTNLTRFTQQTYEAIVEGWFVDGSSPLFNFISTILNYLRSPEVRVLKSIRLCSPTIALLQAVFWRLSLYRLIVINGSSRSDGSMDSRDISPTGEPPKNPEIGHESGEALFADLSSCSNLLFGPEDSEDPSVSSPKSDLVLLHTLCYHICLQIIHGRDAVRKAALKLYRHILSQNLRQLSTIAGDQNAQDIWLSFSRTVMSHPADMDAWLLKQGEKLQNVLNNTLKPASAQFIQRENLSSQNTANSRVLKREERLHQRHLAELAEQHAWTEHDLASGPWADNICESEIFKHFRSRQDQQDGQEYFEALYRKYDATFHMQQSSATNGTDAKWSLDETEGRSRMRMRLLRAEDAQDLEYKPKRRQTIAKSSTLRVDELRDTPKSAASSENMALEANIAGENHSALGGITPVDHNAPTAEPSSADDFEIVQDVEDDLEDKNRKVMRSLQRGEQVHVVYNVSRIRGLEALESLLIVGEKSLYLLSHLFQRSDGEIVNVWQAPTIERDPYTQMITGREIKRPKGSALHDAGIGTRHWPWTEIISVSKRRFLSRPVGLEIFFQDGRSYLLTTMSEEERNKLYSNLLDRAVKLRSSNMPSEDAWRVELLPDPREPPQTVGSRLASVFSLGSLLPATARWVKGEISNFQYLMMINTVAGRTFNDLTQYPVFPWVIADYTSETLDLDNPRTYRDLTKPMGCQSSHRESAFRERFQAFADMSEHRTPAFHYGTHYSTAMIVTSYLIRLQPFVDSYLLLQGGTFDHADRLFYSIEKAWLSASRETMTDVRELTPEFFYLPDFLTNLNKYNFGVREANGERINNVKLPPWAKGDPQIFIAKNREALESPYVSQNLNSWIDLIFGNKQRGEAAIEAVNVFHHLSYQDATDLDTIGDGMERLATIGIIHNFGQTPAQVFSRPHERRESSGSKTKKLHQVIESLHRLPSPIYKHHSQIVQLDYSMKQQRLLCCGPFRSFMPSKYHVVVEWGHTDNSIRFYNSDSKKTLGLFEQPHQDIITSARFVDSTLVTASRDCTVAIWNVNVSPDNVDLQIQGSLFGHRHPVMVLRVSRSLSTILSVDTSGRVLLWDLNGLDLVREISNRRPVQYAQINSLNGHIALCCDQRIVIYTLNGTLLLDQNICGNSSDAALCCSFYESFGSEWIDTELVFTGHRRGIVNVWKLQATVNGTWQLVLVRRLDHIDRARTDGRNIHSAITAICPLDHNLYTGDEEGNVFEWACSR